MLTVLSIAAGTALVLLVAWDVGLTVLHPSARGPLSFVVNRATWTVVGSIARGPGRALSFAGPLAMATSVAAWVTGLWVGFALIYVPYTPEPFYLSAEAITTVGFGDHLAPTPILRLVAAFEAGTGLGAFTAAIAFVLSVYPLVTEVRAASLRLDDLGCTDPEHAARLVAVTGNDELSKIHEDLISVHEHVRRFPVLYYFESGDEDESLTTLLRGGSTLVLVLRWGVDHDACPVAPAYAAAFERTMDRLFTDLDHDFIGGRRGPRTETAALEDAQAALAALRDAVRRGAPGLEASGAEDLDEFARFTGRAEALMREFAREHRQREAPLLAR